MVFLSSNARKLSINTGKMRDIPQLPLLIRMVLFFYPCNNGRILSNVFSILPSLSALNQPLGASFSCQSNHVTAKEWVRSYIIAYLTHSNNLQRLEPCVSKIRYGFIQSIVSMLVVCRVFLKLTLTFLRAGCKDGNITHFVTLGPLNTISPLVCFLHK